MIQNGGGLTESACGEPAHAEDAEQDADARRRPSASTSTSVRCCRTTRSAPGAERHPHRHLAPPQRRARDQQVRHVDARDQQHADAGAEHRVEQRRRSRGRAPSSRRASRPRRRRDWSPGNSLLELRRDRPRPAPVACATLTPGFSRRDHRVVGTLAARLGERIDRQRHPQRLADRKRELLRHHADDRALDAAGADRLARRCPGELP